MKVEFYADRCHTWRYIETVEDIPVPRVGELVRLKSNIGRVSEVAWDLSGEVPYAEVRLGGCRELFCKDVSLRI